MQTTMEEIRSSTTIEAPVERVWRAITTPSEMKQWFFGVDTDADWRPGGTLVHRGEYQGKPYVDKGEILEFDPPRRLVHTHWSDVSGLPDSPEHYQEVAWEPGGSRRLDRADDHRAQPPVRGGSEDLRAGMEGRAAAPQGDARAVEGSGAGPRWSAPSSPGRV